MTDDEDPRWSRTMDVDRYEENLRLWHLEGSRVGGTITRIKTCHRDLWHLAYVALTEVKRLRKLEAAVVGSWMETINRRSNWHKQLRDPCVELGYLTYADHWYELSEEYQDMAKQWVREWYGDEEE